MNAPPDIVEALLTRASARILQSCDYSSGDKSALFAINRLTETYLKSIIYRTLSFARTNKRAKVNYDDIELSFFMESIRLGALEDEMMRINNGPSNDLDIVFKSEKVAKGFESVDRRTQNQLLGPELNGRAGGIPDYMERNMVALPALPPLYTHKRSEVYVDRSRDGLETRENVTKESTLVEASLRKLIEIEEATLGQEEKNLKEEPEDVEMNHEERMTDVMKSSVTDADRQRKKRQDVFRKVWQEMGYGELVKGRAVDCEAEADVNTSSSGLGDRRRLMQT